MRRGRGWGQSNGGLTSAVAATFLRPNPTTRRSQWLSFEQERVMVGIGGTRFRRPTGRAVLDPAAAAARFATGRHALEVLDRHLAGVRFLVGDRCSIADLSLFGYAHVADEAGFELASYPAVVGWLGRVRSRPGFVVDLVPYPENALPGRRRSIYD